ncbi:MAG: MBL fold metallo-hydrolase [Chthoniobacterales bacterium]
MDGTSALTITFLGTGTSHGVPMIGCDCDVCHSCDPRDKRTRTAIAVRTAATAFAIDTPPDFRTQVLREGITHLDAVVFTHSHTDHIMGFDDLRRFSEGGSIPIHADLTTLTDLKRVFQFAFTLTHNWPGYVRPDPHEITGPFTIGDVTLIPTTLPHGHFDVTGFVLSVSGRKLAAYFTDCNDVPPAAMDAARDVPVLIIDALRRREHPTHLTVDRATEIAREMGAAQTYFTHLSHDLAHAETVASLPPGVTLAHDGLTISIP